MWQLNCFTLNTTLQNKSHVACTCLKDDSTPLSDQRESFEEYDSTRTVLKMKVNTPVWFDCHDFVDRQIPCHCHPSRNHVTPCRLPQSSQRYPRRMPQRRPLPLATRRQPHPSPSPLRLPNPGFVVGWQSEGGQRSSLEGWRVDISLPPWSWQTGGSWGWRGCEGCQSSLGTGTSTTSGSGWVEWIPGTTANSRISRGRPLEEKR